MIRKYLCRAMLIALQFMLYQSTAMAQRRASVGTAPDLTRTIDFERRGEFYLGPTGAKGWIYTASNFMTTDARQILITQIAPGSVAEGVLEVGDAILGVHGRI